MAVDQPGCVFCAHDLESLNHLFAQCTYSHQVWNAVFNWLCFSMVYEYVAATLVSVWLFVLWKEIAKRHTPSMSCNKLVFMVAA